MSAPERREPQSEAALDSRPPSLRSLLSSLFFIPLRARSPPYTVPESSSPYSPYQLHWHPPPSREGDRSLSFFLSRSGPTIRPQPQPLLLPVPVHGVCRISPRQPLRRHLPLLTPSPSCTALLSPHSLSLSFFCVPTSTYHFYA